MRRQGQRAAQADLLPAFLPAYMAVDSLRLLDNIAEALAARQSDQLEARRRLESDLAEAPVFKSLLLLLSRSRLEHHALLGALRLSVSGGLKTHISSLLLRFHQPVA